MCGIWENKTTKSQIKIVHVKTDQFQYHHIDGQGNQVGQVLWNYVEILSGYKQISKA